MSLSVAPLEIAAFLAFALLLFAGLCLAYAVGADAAARGRSGLDWGASAFLFAPLYVVNRARRFPARESTPSR